MPVILKKTTPNGLLIGVWEITEPYNELLKMAALNPEESATLNSFKNENRRMQWLAVRTLLSEFISPRPTILYKENGKPFLPGNTMDISISHSGNMAAISLNKNKPTGIDIEEIHTKIHKIATRFVNNAEMAYLNQTTLTEQLCIVWAAKEVLYKIYPEGMLSFKENLSVDGFQLTDNIDLKGTITKEGKSQVYKLVSHKIKNYVLVYTAD
jgi:4'-phosphopantetheinyl transferase